MNMSLDTQIYNKLILQLSDILPEGYLLTSEEELRPYECDGLAAYKRLPVAVCLIRLSKFKKS
jgi:glycolate oxidase